MDLLERVTAHPSRGADMVTPTMPVGGIRPAGGTGATSPVGPADLIIRNGKIYTGDAAQPVATSVAIRDGVFTAVGDGVTIAPHVGVGTRVVDALGRRVIPGLNDSHT